LDLGIRDEEVLAPGRRSEALLITADKDFGELVYRQKLLHADVLLIRLPGMHAPEKAELVARNCEVLLPC